MGVGVAAGEVREVADDDVVGRAGGEGALRASVRGEACPGFESGADALGRLRRDWCRIERCGGGMLRRGGGFFFGPGWEGRGEGAEMIRFCE